MSEGRLRADWARTVAAMRLQGLTTAGREPPLAALIPGRFVPRFRAPKADAVDPETNRRTVATIIAAGFPADVVTRIDRLLNVAEYKRRQAAPGVKISARNLGRDRRYPITHAFRTA